MSNFENAEIKAHEKYNEKIAILKCLHGKDNLSFELDAHDHFGHNSLQLLLNMYGHYDAGWIDDAEFSNEAKNRILAFNRQDIVSTNAITKSLFKKVYVIEKNVKVIKWLFVAILLLNLFIIVR